ncbi:MAG: 2-C-methyl-D-erythritol 4-phosphate cytidylyltransferase [Candidatus Omnitrophica bacterium]|jgi:2-C-methyl-D-erythritol 4-phosphate cytidylyltransferase|nr:2-C-methyl-D-erythritol 4-phosphate cytidylyltransferase [Candidatus Omnitrophota bacterium]
MAFKVGVIIVCAGEGKRLGKIDKARLKLNGLLLFQYAVGIFLKIRPIKQVVLVLRKKDFSLAKRKIKDSRVIIVQGGKQRKDSVQNGLAALAKDINYVLIHDGARPFVSIRQINIILKELKIFPAVICGLESPDTLKIVKKEYVQKTIDRENIFLIQTPQGFKKTLLIKAYKKFRERNFTDDAQLLELLGQPIRLVPGEIANFKITYPQDIRLARAINYEKL